MNFNDLIVEVRTQLAETAPGAEVVRGIDAPAREGDPITGRVAAELGDFSIVPLTKSSNVGGNARPLMTWQQQVKLTVWARAVDQADEAEQQGADEDAAVELAKRVVAAFWAAATGGSLKGGAGKPATAAKTITYGALLEFALLLEEPVLEATSPIAFPLTPANGQTLQPQT